MLHAVYKKMRSAFYTFHSFNIDPAMSLKIANAMTKAEDTIDDVAAAIGLTVDEIMEALDDMTPKRSTNPALTPPPTRTPSPIAMATVPEMALLTRGAVYRILQGMYHPPVCTENEARAAVVTCVSADSTRVFRGLPVNPTRLLWLVGGKMWGVGAMAVGQRISLCLPLEAPLMDGTFRALDADLRKCWDQSRERLDVMHSFVLRTRSLRQFEWLACHEPSETLQWSGLLQIPMV